MPERVRQYLLAFETASSTDQPTGRQVSARSWGNHQPNGEKFCEFSGLISIYVNCMILIMEDFFYATPGRETISI